jgi:hypothetical protein
MKTMSPDGLTGAESVNLRFTGNTPAEERIFGSDGEAAQVTALDIAERAYQLWEQRGCPYGCPEEDWFQAENELRAR